MRVAQAMTRNVRVASPDQNLIEAAKMMEECDCGSLPVGENDRLVGMITDRDIVIRALAQDKDAHTKIRDIMSDEIEYCFEDDDVTDVAHNMGDLQVRRMAVLNSDKRLTGIISLGDIVNTGELQSATDALSGISEPTSLRLDEQTPRH